MERMNGRGVMIGRREREGKEKPRGDYPSIRIHWKTERERRELGGERVSLEGKVRNGSTIVLYGGEEKRRERKAEGEARMNCPLKEKKKENVLIFHFIFLLFFSLFYKPKQG